MLLDNTAKRGYIFSWQMNYNLRFREPQCIAGNQISTVNVNLSAEGAAGYCCTFDANANWSPAGKLADLHAEEFKANIDGQDVLSYMFKYGVEIDFAD